MDRFIGVLININNHSFFYRYYKPYGELIFEHSPLFFNIYTFL